jgi:hypothetical protein
MRHKRDLDYKLVLRGALMGALSAAIGSGIFALINTTRNLLLNLNSVRPDSLLSLLFVYFILGCFISVGTAAIGGGWLALSLGNDAQKNEVKPKKAFLKGASLGILVGIGLCCIVLVLTNFRIPWSNFLIYSLQVVLFALLAGGWSGRKIAIGLLTDDVRH